jgi:hypothetical protein
MPDQNIQAQIDVSFDIDLKDSLFGANMVNALLRNRMQLRSATLPAPPQPGRAGRQIVSFVAGLCLAYFHLNAAALVAFSAANALGYITEFAPYQVHYVSAATASIGLLWLWLLIRQPIEKYQCDAAYKNLWRIDFPEILHDPVPVSIRFSADSVAFNMLGSHHTIPLSTPVKLVETDNYCVLKLGTTQLPIPRNKLPPQNVSAILSWSAAHNILFTPVMRRRTRLPPLVSACFGAVLCVFCLWVATHNKAWQAGAVTRTSVKLELRDATTIIAGQTVHLEQLRYSASDRQGVLYDTLTGTISRPDIGGTFFMDRNSTSNLAQTPQEEFEDERTWHLAIGQIPADAAIEPLPNSGVFIAWDQPPSADYPGHCGALRSNSNTTPAAAGRVLFRNRLWLQICSATMSKAEVRDWALQAIPPLNQQFALRTQTTPE